MLTLLLACTAPPTPEALAERVLAGDLEGVTRALVALEPAADSPLAPWRETALALDRLAGERTALRAAERGVVVTRAREALDAGALDAAVPALAAGLETWPDDPELLALSDALEQRAAGEPDPVAAAVWGALAEVWERQPERAARYARDRDRAALRARYAPEALIETRAAQAGVRPAAAHHLLAKLDAELHAQPDWRVLAAAGNQRLAWLAEAPGARAVWPGLDDLTLPDPGGGALADAAAALDLALTRGAAAGVPDEVVVAEWVDGALDAIDPWTRVVWPAEIALWQAHHAGVTVGVGLTLEQRPDQRVALTAVAMNSPAWTCGFHTGDVLEAVALPGAPPLVLAEVAPEARVEAAERAIAGEEGSPLALTVTRNDGPPATCETARAAVAMETVRGFQRAEDNTWDAWIAPDEGLAVVRILGFREASEPDFDALVDRLVDLRGLLLDLRGNPGGDINAATQIADRFIATGILADLTGRVEVPTTPEIDPETGRKLANWNDALEGHWLEGMPVVVLVDDDTASAAELLAGALQERAGAVVLGEPTWGKGMAQALRLEAEQGYAVQFTNLVWTLPSGRRLAHTLDGGVTPDLPLSLSPAERFQADLLGRRRAAPRTWPDGTPAKWVGQVVREDLPPLSDDPALLEGLMVLRAHVLRQGALSSSP